MDQLSAKPPFSVEYLKSVLHYDPATGVFTWLARTSYKSRIIIGSIAGSIHKYKGCRNIWILMRGYRAANLAWFYMTGEWPGKEVDHSNMNNSDDRWLNLRLATRSQNVRNRRIPKNNKSGYRGVYQTPYGKWMAQIVVDKRNHYLGTYDSMEAASTAYNNARTMYFGEFA